MVFAELDFSYLPLFVGIGVGTLIFCLALVLKNRSWKNVVGSAQSDEPDGIKGWVSQKSNPRSLPSEQKSQEGYIMLQSQSEKRRAFRRKGKCLEVEIMVKDGQGTHQGLVLDRSINGLRLGVDKEFAPDTILKIRILNLYPPMAWLEIKVAHCKLNESGWEIGCEFVTTPTWNIMMLFG